MKTTGNTILITGGTAGIGHGLALRFHEAGNKVIIAGRRKELLDQITTEHPGIDSLVLDVTDPTSITRAADTLAASHPRLNVLVNNAGIMLPENLLDLASLPIAEDHVTTNLLGAIRMTYAFLPHLVTKDDAVVMNITSALAFVPLPITPTYNATKAALRSFSESLRVQVAGTPKPTATTTRSWQGSAAPDPDPFPHSARATRPVPGPRGWACWRAAASPASSTRTTCDAPVTAGAYPGGSSTSPGHKAGRHPFLRR